MGIFSKLSLMVALGLAIFANSLKAELLYVAGNGISAFHISENGSLIAIPGASSPVGDEYSIAVDRLGRFLYGIGSYGIKAYRISRSGALTFLSVAPAGIGPDSISVDPLGRFAFVSNFGSLLDLEDPAKSNVSAYHLGNNGSLTPVKGSPFLAGVFPTAAVVDPFGRFVFVANSGTQTLATETVSGYKTKENGVLEPLTGSPFANGEGPVDAAIDPWGRFLYAADYYDSAFSVYQIAENGALKQVPGSPFTVEGSSSSVVVDPLGRFVYVSHYEGSVGSVSGFRVAGNGVLTEVPGSPFRIGSPNVMAIDLSGRFLYVPAEGSGISAYRISANGSLTSLPGSPFLPGVSPTSIVVCPEHHLVVCP